MKKLIILTFLLMLLGFWAKPIKTYAAITLVNNTSTPGKDPTSAAINMTGANFLFLEISCYSASVVEPCATPTDSQNNTWHNIGFTDSNDGKILDNFYAYNATVASNQTFSEGANAHGDAYGMLISGYAGVLSTSDPMDASSSQDGGCGSGTSCQVAAFTPPNQNDLVISDFDGDGGSGTTVSGGSLTMLNTIDFASGIAWQQAAAYVIQTASSTVTPTWSWTTSVTYYASADQSFKAAPSTASPVSYSSLVTINNSCIVANGVTIQ